MNPKTQFVVLVSGNGSNLQAILDAISTGVLDARVTAVISNRPDAYGLERARLAGIPAVVKIKSKTQTREAYDGELADLVESYSPHWVVLAGWMRILSLAFLGRFPNRVINLHPALPGTFPGVGAIERALTAYQAGEIDHTGVMVHLVPDEGVDVGPVINQSEVPIFPEDSLEDLEWRIHTCEHTLLVQSLIAVTKDTENKIPQI